MVMLEYHCSVQKEGPSHPDVPDDPHDVLAVERVLPATMMPQGVTVALQRTVRVPDNDSGHPSALPPGLGYFPIFKTQDYASRLPRDVALNGGVFVPVYQREAMWLRFQATAPFMVKVYVGGVNAVSGEHAAEGGGGARERRAERRGAGGSIQDYVVVPEQLWLDGVAVETGAVRQFVAMPVAQGYTVEAQMTGRDVCGGMQIEITPARRRPVSSGYQIFVRTLMGKTISLVCGPDCRVRDLKNIIQGREGLAPDDQRFIHAGKQLNDDMTLGQCGVQNASTLHLLLRLRGGGPAHQLGIAAGGKIWQEICEDTYNPDSWLRELTFTFPIHILNSEAFRTVTGIDPPPSPISAEAYVQVGLPFYHFYDEEFSDVSGSENFKALKSINQVDKDRGLVEEEDVGLPVPPQNVVNIYPMHHSSLIVHENDGDLYAVNDPDGLLRPAGPHRVARSVADLEAEMDSLHMYHPSCCPGGQHMPTCLWFD